MFSVFFNKILYFCRKENAAGNHEVSDSALRMVA